MTIPRATSFLLLLAAHSVASAAPAEWTTAATAASKATFDVLVDDQHYGTGFFVDADGHALTAAHVVAIGDRRLELLLPDGTRTAATVLARDLGHDVALLRAPEREAAYPFLPVAEKEPAIGQSVAVFGTPLLRRQLMLFGHVASAGLGYEYLGGRQHYVECRHVSGIGPKGTSGGPWLDPSGHVVGLQVGGISLTSGWQGVSFVAPAASLRHIVEHKKDRPTRTIRVAVEETWQQPPEFFENVPPGTDGLVVKVLDRNGPASRAGLQLGDVVVSADGERVRFVRDLLTRIREKGDEAEIALELLGRSGNPNRTVKVPVHVLIEGNGEER